MADWRRQIDVTHALAPNLGPCHFDTALVAHDALEADALVLPAIALPVLCRTKDALAEQTVLLRLQGPVVDRLRLSHFAIRPRPNLLR